MRITDKWLSTILRPDRNFRDYYGYGSFGRVTVRMSQASKPQVIFDRTLIAEVTRRDDLLALLRILQVDTEAVS